ncbi:hypothetical protein [Bradyrhizobium japonicum]|uniref:hypothetical protein n=1 Tax=Bradyrhizobium japonicum TaxID=375 RepID=UPI00190F49C2|nr:hypothetical protein [Bradyrhizobium japonicum]
MIIRDGQAYIVVRMSILRVRRPTSQSCSFTPNVPLAALAGTGLTKDVIVDQSPNTGGILHTDTSCNSSKRAAHLQELSINASGMPHFNGERSIV